MEESNLWVELYGKDGLFRIRYTYKDATENKDVVDTIEMLIEKYGYTAKEVWIKPQYAEGEGFI